MRPRPLVLAFILTLSKITVKIRVKTKLIKLYDRGKITSGNTWEHTAYPDVGPKQVVKNKIGFEYLLTKHLVRSKESGMS